MRPYEADETDRRRPVSVEPVAAPAGLDGLRATCRRQAHVIDMLAEALSELRRAAAALQAENADLRAAGARVGGRGGARARASARSDAGEALELSLALDRRAPAAARAAVADGLRDQVAASVLAGVQLVVSELVADGVRHSGASAAASVVVRVRLTGAVVRVELEYPGRGGAIAPDRPDLAGGGGFGLKVVRSLSERWGLERIAAGGVCVWAQLPRAPLMAPASGAAGARSSRDAGPSSGRAGAWAPAAAGGRSASAAAEVHVVPDERSVWRVVEGDAAAALSEHTSATAAERAARARAEQRDAARVVIHDRYHRTHDVALSPAGASAQANAQL